MDHLSPAVARLAAGLAVIVGFADTLTLLKIVPYLRQVGLGHASTEHAMFSLLASVAGPALALIVAFVAGVAMSSLIGHWAKSRRHQAVLSLVAVLFALAALLNVAASAGAAVLTIAMALGALHGVLENVPAASIGILVAIRRLGERLAITIVGTTSRDWKADLLLWLGLLTGIAAGLFVDPLFGLGGIWLAAALAGLLSIVAVSMRPQ